MRNRYPGICTECDEKVEVGEGFFRRAKTADGRLFWKLMHAEHSAGYKSIGADKSVRNVKHYKNNNK